MDVYRSISRPGAEVLFKDQKSKFFGYAFPINGEDDINKCLDTLKEKHPNANHYCYAWQLGIERIRYRANDDGEPKNSAGMPIYGQIQSFDLTNVLVVVVRFFGGVKLGVGGLINAYRSTARLALEAADVSEFTVELGFEITFDYPSMNKVMQLLKREKWNVRSIDQGSQCVIRFSVRKSDKEKALDLLNNLREVQIAITE
ncbi:IMPACT family protein [Poritiphilus flavus]|uniref:YigZ family protein n=1 Tax=Poritiphilus flavus TaxID=2697053 RepID=A0A6L9EF46_9FLAO|nr:YigZ family protein [Poritiphilus flavus]NAS13365.1 YigZ family protein [Poritiphilus flavus]